MKCFYHQQSDAVGICRNCSKGLCQECVVDVRNGIACKNRCENAVIAMNELIDRNKASYQKTSESYVRNAIIYGLLAFLFLVLGLIEINTPLIYFMFPAAIIFFLGAGFCYSTGKKLRKK